MPLAGTYAFSQSEQKEGQLQFMSIQEALDRYRVETNSKIIPYVVRDHAWNFDHHDKTNYYRYREDSPEGYRDAVNYMPHPTNKPVPPKVVLDIKDKEEADDKADIKEEEERKKKQQAKDKEQLEKEKKEEDAEIEAEKKADEKKATNVTKAQVNTTQAGLIAANASAKANSTVNITANATVNATANATVNASANASSLVNATLDTTANATTNATANTTANVTTNIT